MEFSTGHAARLPFALCTSTSPIGRFSDPSPTSDPEQPCLETYMLVPMCVIGFRILVMEATWGKLSGKLKSWKTFCTCSI